MLRKLLPLVIALIGLGAGVGAGIALRPAPQADGAADGKAHAAENDSAVAAADGCVPGETRLTDAPPPPPKADPTVALVTEFVPMPNQFVIPLIREGDVAALVVVSITLEVAQGQSDPAVAREPKLRDLFLRVLLDHANSGGFDGAFTANMSMTALRRALEESARTQLGPALTDVLITEINRQNV
jgi:hypothetical protein